MKKVVINESSLSILGDAMKYKLPDYLYKSVKTHNTSLGDSPAFPPSDDYSFDYKLLKIRYKVLVDKMNHRHFPLDMEKAENLLYKLTTRAIEIEKPLRPQLQKLVENTVYKMFAIPPETIDLSCELVDEVKPKNALRILPEDDVKGDNDYTFKDVDEINMVGDIVKQRRFVDSLIQGYSIILTDAFDYYDDELINLSDELYGLSRDIELINDYLVFVKKEKMDKKHPSLVAYVEVHLGKGSNKTQIKSQGLLFIYLLRETIRGLMELFSSHGLPKDNHKAQKIIRMADFTMAEPWDARFGTVLWEMMFGRADFYPSQIPYIFSEFCSQDVQTFFDITKELLAHTKKGDAYIKDVKTNINHDEEYHKFLNTIKQKNIDQSVITDGYLTADDLDNYTIQEDSSNLEENLSVEDKYDDFAHDNMNKHLVIFDKDEYPNLQSLINGVRNHTLLIHARKVEDGTLNDLQYGLDPTIDRTILDAYGGDYKEAYGDYSEEERDEYAEKYGDDEDAWPKPEEGNEYWHEQMIPMVFASDDLTWCHGSRNGVIFVRAEGFEQKSPDTMYGSDMKDSHMDMYRMVEADGEFSDWFYDDKVPIYVEAGDYFTDKVADVVAVLNLNAPIQESIIRENQEIEYSGQGVLGNLKSYLTMTDDEKNDDLLYRYDYDIYDFIMSNGWEDDFTDDELAELKENNENDIENNIYIIKDHEDCLEAFLQQCKEKSIEYNENANDTMEYEKDIDINKEWLIHFTHDPGGIAYNGFTSGTNDLESLALTRRDPNMSEGYDFAFLADEVSNYEASYYCGNDKDKWGAVMFHANGIQTWHYGDNQRQIVFWGPSAFDIIPIYHGDVSDYVDWDHENDYRSNYYDTWYIMDDKTDRIIFTDDDINNIVSWVENNWFQYRRRLNRITFSKNDFYRPKKKKNFPQQ